MLKETALQKLIVEALELQIKVAGKDALVVSNYNNATSARDGAAAKRMGRKAGIPDLSIFCTNGKVIFVEIKTERGALSPAQKKMHAWLKARDYEVRMIYGYDPLEIASIVLSIK